MKCLYCLTENRLKDRVANQGRCSKCGHAFAFEPTDQPHKNITDRLFAKAIDVLSVNQTLLFTSKHLFYYLEWRIAKQKSIALLVPAVLLLFLSFPLSGFIVIGLSTIWTGFRNLLFPVNILLLISMLLLVADSSFQTIKVQAINALSLLVIVWGLLSLQSWTVPVFCFLVGGFGFCVARLIKDAYDTHQPSQSLADVEALLRRWQATHGPIPSLLPPAKQQPRGTTPSSAEELKAYSFDRLLFCQTPELVQFLVANNIHFEHNCAIVTADGYPHSIYSLTMAMVQTNPELKVYALHDCSAEGLRFVHQLNQLQPWLTKNNIAVCDIGLLPRQVMNNPKTFFIQRHRQTSRRRGSLPRSVAPHLRAEEVEWLSKGFAVELESLSPRRLIQILSRSLVAHQTLERLDTSPLLFFADSAVYAGPENFG